MNRYSIALGKRPPRIKKAIKLVVVKRRKEKKRARQHVALTRRARESLISQALSTPAGRTRLAQSMMNPLQQRMDYAGIARRAFVVEPLPEGALPIYEAQPHYDVTEADRNGDAPTSPNIESFVIGENEPPKPLKGHRVLFPLFELVSNPTINFQQVRERRYNLIDRAQDLARQEIDRLRPRRSRRPRTNKNISGGTIG